MNALKDPGSLPGKRAWIWADSEMQMVNNRRGVGTAYTWKQAGPDLWLKGEDQVPYGEAVEVLKYDEWPGTFGRVTVKADDGRTYIVPASTVKLYEFWNCSVTELLATRWVTNPKGGGNITVKTANTAWVRLVDKSMPVEQYFAWMKAEDVAKIDLMLCRDWFPPQPNQSTKEYPLKCQIFTARGWGESVSLDPKAVEVVSPTSMKIMLTN